jgi:hypothetical protein
VSSLRVAMTAECFTLSEGNAILAAIRQSDRLPFFQCIGACGVCHDALSHVWTK